MTTNNEKPSEDALAEAVMREEDVASEGPTSNTLPKQHHNFIPVTETSRTYIFPGKEQVKVDYVYGVSIRQDGGHRLLTRANPKAGFTIAPGWITIIHEANDDSIAGYVFTE